jgi:hypothetical protein
MGTACAKHPERAGTTECRGCRASLCAACALLTPQGNWCSAECAVVHKALSAKPKEDPVARRMGLALKVMLAFAMMLGLMLLFHAAASRGVKAAKPFDLLGRLFESLGVLTKRESGR